MFNYNVQNALRKLQEDPKEFLRKAGVNVPDELMNDPQAIVMHLIRSGQVSSPMINAIMPMIRNMGGK